MWKKVIKWMDEDKFYPKEMPNDIIISMDMLYI